MRYNRTQLTIKKWLESNKCWSLEAYTDMKKKDCHSMFPVNCLYDEDYFQHKGPLVIRAGGSSTSSHALCARLCWTCHRRHRNTAKVVAQHLPVPSRVLRHTLPLLPLQDVVPCLVRLIILLHLVVHSGLLQESWNNYWEYKARTHNSLDTRDSHHIYSLHAMHSQQCYELRLWPRRLRFLSFA